MTFNEHLQQEAQKLPWRVLRLVLVLHFPLRQAFMLTPFEEISWECRCGAKS